MKGLIQKLNNQFGGTEEHDSRDGVIEGKDLDMALDQSPRKEGEEGSYCRLAASVVLSKTQPYGSHTPENDYDNSKIRMFVLSLMFKHVGN